MDSDVCIINYLDHFNTSVQLLFYLFKCFIITRQADCHTGHRFVLRYSYCQAIQIVGLSRKQSRYSGKDAYIIFNQQTYPPFFHIPLSSLSKIMSSKALPGGTIGITFSSGSMINSMTVGTFKVCFAVSSAAAISFSFVMRTAFAP